MTLITLMGDFNVEVSETSLSFFCELYEVKSIIKQSTCYKIPTNPSRKSTVVESALSDFHKLIVTVMKSYSPKRTPNIVNYRNYTNFVKDKFNEEISFNLTKHSLQESTL